MNKKPIGIHINPRTEEPYFLHKKESKSGVLYYFSREIIGAIPIPDGYGVVTNRKTGLPLLKKKRPEEE